jgi:hypothetical protein
MKKKIAICLSGHLHYSLLSGERNKILNENKKDENYTQKQEERFDQEDPIHGYKNLLNKFKNYEIDFYIHSWSKRAEDRILSTYNPKNFLIEDQINFEANIKKYSFPISEEETLEKKNLNSNFLSYYLLLEARKKEKKEYSYNDLKKEMEVEIYRTSSRYYSLKKSIKLLLENVKKEKIDYDFFVITRFGNDKYFYWKPKIENMNKNSIYVEGRIGRIDEKLAVNDGWFICGKNNISLFETLYDLKEEYSIRAPFAFKQHFDKHHADVVLIEKKFNQKNILKRFLDKIRNL